MAEGKMLKDEELEEVTGGASGSENEVTYVSFEVNYCKGDGRYDIMNFIKRELRNRGVPEAVVARVPVMNPEKPYMSYGDGGLRVTWQKGWSEPRFEKTHD